MGQGEGFGVRTLERCLPATPYPQEFKTRQSSTNREHTTAEGTFEKLNPVPRPTFCGAGSHSRWRSLVSIACLSAAIGLTISGSTPGLDWLACLQAVQLVSPHTHVTAGGAGSAGSAGRLAAEAPDSFSDSRIDNAKRVLKSAGLGGGGAECHVGGAECHIGGVHMFHCHCGA